jgi:GxxExxY protein
LVIGVFFEVYNELGPGFLESVYKKSMLIALAERGLRAEEESRISVWFRGQCVGDFRADLLVDQVIIVELEAGRAPSSEHEARLIHYLRSTEMEVGLLFHFGAKPSFKRFYFDNPRKKALLCQQPLQNPNPQEMRG